MESGFHDNRLDEAFLLQDANLRRIAEVQVDIILDVLGLKRVAPVPPPVPPSRNNTPSNWAREAWAWAFDNGLTDGTNPQGTPTREQMMQLLFNYHQWQSQ